MQSQSPINDDGRDIIIPQIRFQKNNDASKKMGVGCFILFGLLFFGGGGAFVIAGVASGSATVSFNNIPLGVVGGIVFLLGLFGYCIFQYFPAIETLFGSSSVESVKPTNCVISMKGIFLHGKDGSKYILKWSGLQSIAICDYIPNQTYIAFRVKDQRYNAACEHTNSFVSTKYNVYFKLVLPESSLPMPAADFTQLLVQRAQSQGTQLPIEGMYGNLETYEGFTSNSSNPELDKLHEQASDYGTYVAQFLAVIIAACIGLCFLTYIGGEYGLFALLAVIIILPLVVFSAYHLIIERNKRT